MDKSKKNITGLVFLSLIVVLLVIICIFSNAFFYTPKEYADKVITEKISSLNERLKKTRAETKDSLDFIYLKENSIYTVDFDIDKRFAYENNFPYFENLSASLASFDDGSSSYNSISVSNGGKCLIEVDAVVSQEESFIAIPSLIDGYYLSEGSYIEYIDGEQDYDFDDEEDYDYYDFDNTFENPSLLAYIIRYSSLDPDSLGDLGVDIFTDIFQFLTSECYIASMGAFGSGEVIVSVSEQELAQALYNAIRQNSNNELFKQMITSSFPETEYEQFVGMFLAGLKELECSSQNIYTIGFKTGITGQIRQLCLSYIVDGQYKTMLIEFSKNKILVTLKDNSKFESEVQEFNERTFEIVYGVNKDKSVKGYIQYTENSGNALAYFDALKLSNGFIDGTIELIRTDDESVSVRFNSDNKDVLVSYDREEESLASLHMYRKDCEAAPFDAKSIGTGQVYLDMTDFTEDLLSSDAFAAFTEELQIDQFSAWLETLSEMYLLDGVS